MNWFWKILILFDTSICLAVYVGQYRTHKGRGSKRI